MRKVFLVNFKEAPTILNDKDNTSKIGGGKYDNDILKIFFELGFKLEYYSIIRNKFNKFVVLINLIKTLLFSERTLYFFRYPFLYWNKNLYYIQMLYQWILFYIMKISKHKIGVIISDLDFVRNEGFKKIYKDIRFLKNFDYIIVHNDVMKDFLIKNGLDKNKLINQEIGNNLSESFIVPKRSLSKTLVFSGNLSKSKFLSKFNNENMVSYKINLYGMGFDKKNENKILNYKGSYSSEDIVKKLNGSFGLIWDGDEINTCSGFYGEYTKINNPSKFSQYIVAGLPVIVWKKSAVSKVVKEYNIGFSVNNLIELDTILNNMNENLYQYYLSNVMRLREKVMQGYHFRKAISEVLTMEKIDETFYYK